MYKNFQSCEVEIRRPKSITNQSQESSFFFPKNCVTFKFFCIIETERLVCQWLVDRKKHTVGYRFFGVAKYAGFCPPFQYNQTYEYTKNCDWSNSTLLLKRVPRSFRCLPCYKDKSYFFRLDHSLHFKNKYFQCFGQQL